MKRIIIPIKTNNQRLPGKNTMLLSGKPLYQYLFDTVKKCKRDLLDIEVYVDSSDDSILNIASENGFKTIKRSESLNSPETSGNDLIKHAISRIKCSDSDIIGQFFVTTPFLKKETVINCFEILLNTKTVSSCFGVYPVYDRFWLNDQPVNHKKNVLEGTQYMKPLMREAGFYAFRCGDFKKQNSRITDKFKSFSVTELECVDIDTQFDFDYAQSLLNSGLVNEY